MCEQVNNIKFVGEVQKYPLLYNYKLPEYSRKDLVEKAWMAVGKEVHLTVSECKEKWKNLRAVFVRHMKPVPSGSKKKRPYYLADAMQFTLPFIKVLASCKQGNLSEAEEEIEAHETDSQLQLLCPVSVCLDKPGPSSQRKYRAVPPQNQSGSESGNTNTASGKHKRSISEVDDALVDNFKSNEEDNLTASHNEKSQARKMFLLSLLPELDELTNHQMKIFKRKVLQLIDDIQLSSMPSTADYLSGESSLVATPSPSIASSPKAVGVSIKYEAQQNVYCNKYDT